MDGNDGLPELAALEQLQREAAELAQVFGGVSAAFGGAATGDFDGADETESVRVTVDAQGRVVGVELAADWSAHIESTELGTAVRTAITDATQRRFEAWGQAVEEATERPAAVPPTAPPAAPPTAPEASIDELFYLLMEVSDQLEGLARGFEAAAQQIVEGRSRHDYVTVAIRNGEVIDIRCDGRWLRQTDAALVSLHLKQAFDAAYRAADQAAPKESSSLQEFRARSGDPIELLRRLGPGGTT
jgi:DNA-binding protein YbaB